MEKCVPNQAIVNKSSSSIEEAYRFSVAPMLDWTDSHFRVLMRQITKRSLLYTEMVVAKALHHQKNPCKLLNFDNIEHPIALQIGGDEPKLLAEAAKLAEEWGYDEINLNVGCPSKKVRSGNFGACLMAKPSHVAQCVEAMTNASSIPVTVKHRLGIDDLDNDYLLKNFVVEVANGGAKRFAIHARKAWLEGLNPKENRTIPPLQYERVAALKKQLPHVIIELNGGLQTPIDCINALAFCDGAMVGRAAYEHPLRWKNIDEIIYGDSAKEINPSEIIKNLLPYAEKHLARDGKLWDISRHLLQIVEGVPGARLWRKNLTLKAQNRSANLTVLEEAIKELENLGL
ncbi:tRNA dihydrouridine(20/20a) synthase DusA [Prochlorococcus sp. MIT 1300]|uniref:tRNA dihydrouridine(20/20a) synthase DusA n=1 Tax=Prochlorococcus sp. MIT 1300 TaxID=3096218 RepID=UPI002A7554CC|nr:tRNA dihydrouridine(20/20a) synthase DusA [Prochlorococcus sp. MIT 1300]